MSDTLQTNQDQSDARSAFKANSLPREDQPENNVDIIDIPDQDHSAGAVDTFDTSDAANTADASGLLSLFQDDEDDNAYIAPKRKRHYFWPIAISLLVLLALVGGGAFFYMQRAQASQVQYRTTSAAYGNLTKAVSASGPLSAKAEYDLNFSTAGQIHSINVKVGQQVKAGQVLATLYAPNLEIAVEQAQLTVNNDQTTYNTDVSNGDAQATLDAANLQLQSAQLQLQTAQNNLAAATMTAPANATVAAINGIVGQNTSGGNSSSASSSLIVLLDTSGFTITASVNEADIASVQINQPVSFTVSAYTTQTFSASVSSLSIVGTTSAGVVTYPVTLTVNMSSIGSAHLYPGMTATVSITTAQRIGALLVSNSAFTFPTTAIQAGVISRSALTQGLSGITQSSTSAGTRHVVIVLRNGKLVPVLITTGLTNGAFSEVLSGLTQGDQVVIGATGGSFSTLSTSTSSPAGGGTQFRGGGFGGGGRVGSGG